MTKGFVSLVGAGPGAPDLLTIRALDRLRAADLVLYDALVAPEVVALADRAQRFSVGKRAGRRSVRQDTITRVMVRAARRGRRVVRLKCGDPYVLGRGGEEALALGTAGVPFEVVQGLTAAVAVPALAHRMEISRVANSSHSSPRAAGSARSTARTSTVTPYCWRNRSANASRTSPRRAVMIR